MTIDIINKMSCCVEPNEKLVDDVVVCINCCSLVDSVQFEEPYQYDRAVPSMRLKKFEEVVYKADLEWWIRQTLLDFFPRIERYFEETSRKNFINLSHLCHSILKYMGYSEDASKFECLKTKARAKLVDEFVRDMFIYYSSNSGGVLLKDVPMISLIGSSDLDMSKVVSDGHIYSDKTSIDAKVVPKPKAKAKGRGKKAQD